MNQWLRNPTLLISLLTIGSMAWAGSVMAVSPHPKAARHTCPQCHSCCELKIEKGEEDRHCWEVETKKICIPRVVFPWQKSDCNPGVNNGATIKTVRVLKKREYQCPVCEYNWTPREKCRPSSE